MRKKYTKDKKYRFNIRLSLSEYESLNRLAYKDGISMSDVIRVYIIKNSEDVYAKL